MKTNLGVKFGQSSWRIAIDEVEAFVTETGGPLSLVTFRMGGNQDNPLAKSEDQTGKLAGAKKIPPPKVGPNWPMVCRTLKT